MKRTTWASVSPVDREREADRAFGTRGGASPATWRASDLALLQRLWQQCASWHIRASAAKGGQEAARVSAGWQGFLRNCLRKLAASDFDQLSEKQRAVVHAAARKRGWEIPPPEHATSTIGPLPKRPPGR